MVKRVGIALAGVLEGTGICEDCTRNHEHSSHQLRGGIGACKTR